MNNATLYAEVILPLSLKGTLTYRVPEQMHDFAKVGMRVLVQLGKQKLYSGIIKILHTNTPEGFEAKAILDFPDREVLVSSLQLQFWDWLSTYYMCSLGEVMNAALPGGLKLASETVFQLNPSFDEYIKLTPEERVMFQFLEENKGTNLDEIIRSHFGQSGIRIANLLMQKGAVLTDQHLKKAYQARKISRIALHPSYENQKAYAKLMDTLAKAPAQLKALEEFARISGSFEKETEVNDVERRALLQAGVAGHAIKGLISKGVFRSYEIRVSRIHHDAGSEEISAPFSLEIFQEKALSAVRNSLQKFPAVLLHGVTSSGKTEIYIHLIREQIARGNQVLYLLPEIALTTQIIQRLKRVFGKSIGVYHSKYSENERVEVYRNLCGLTEESPYSVILGVRAAVFLPFQKLGLIIVDEEHENTYKQFDPAPRYHARDAVTILGLYTGAKVIMGSATPSFETLNNAKSGKYGLVELNERYGQVALPEVVLADVSQARKRKQLKAHFTPELILAMEETLSRGEQAILFQNRRGYSNYLICDDCNSILKCGSCDVSLTYHKYQHEMLCHYCGFKSPVPRICPECHSNAYHMKGFGTEKIEDDIQSLFPDVKVGRLDLDKTRSRKAFEQVIADFEKGKIQLLVGTQLLTKGLDFDKLTLVGIIDADSMLNFPDFRAFERSFQLMTQVSGRAGRRNTRGKVVIQCTDPGHPVIQKVLHNDFDGFFKDQMEERKMFHYPPYVRMIKITLRHEIPSILDGGAVFLANEMKEIFGNRVLGPQQPIISRTHGKYIKQIILKIEKEASAERAKNLLQQLLDLFSQNPVYKQIRRTVDVDPM